MQQILTPAPASSASSYISDKIECLAELYRNAVSVVVCKRVIDRDVSAFVQKTLLGHDWDASLRVNPARCDLRSLFPQTEATGLRADLTFLVEVFADLLGTEEVGLRLVCQHAPGCPRFHVDRVTARMVCAYHGAGTQWLEHEDVRRAYLGHASKGASDEESGLIAGPIQQMQTFDIGILKGEGWNGNEGRGAVHRSPAAAKERRLFVSLDALG